MISESPRFHVGVKFRFFNVKVLSKFGCGGVWFAERDGDGGGIGGGAADHGGYVYGDRRRPDRRDCPEVSAGRLNFTHCNIALCYISVLFIMEE